MRGHRRGRPRRMAVAVELSGFSVVIIYGCDMSMSRDDHGARNTLQYLMIHSSF
jgi:hypothetical protein